MKPTDHINLDSDFVRYFSDHGKPASRWVIGAEIEVFGFQRDTLSRITPVEVQSVMQGFAANLIEAQSENGLLIEATLPDHSRITLEPGGQIEFSGAPHQALDVTEGALKNFLARLQEIGEPLGILFVAVGFDPLRNLEEQQWISKRRYEIMRPYLASRGRRAWDMMCRTAAIQVNLDYRDLEDLAKKFTVANRFAPIAAAMFANSPFQDGKLSGYKSTRYAAWLETDSQRTGAAPCALDGEFSLPRFIEYIKAVPMFFIRRNDEYVNLAGYDFRTFLATGTTSHAPIAQDFTDHLTTIFTEARLKPYIEQRSMDCGHLELVMAALAFWQGLLYDEEALNQALELAPKINGEEYRALQIEVARHGLAAQYQNIFVGELATAAVELARAGLQKIAPDAVKYLDILEQYTINEKICPADILIRNFNGRWHGDIRKAIDYLQI